MIFGSIAVSTMQKAESAFSPILSDTIPRLVQIERLGLPAFEAATIASRIIATPTGDAVLSQIAELSDQVDAISRSAKSPVFADLSVVERMQIAVALVSDMENAAKSNRTLFPKAQKKILDLFSETQLLRERIARDLIITMKSVHSNEFSSETPLEDLNILTGLIGELIEIQTALEHLTDFETTEEIKKEEGYIKIHISDLFLKISRVNNTENKDEYAAIARQSFFGFLNGDTLRDALKVGNARAELVVAATDLVELLNSLKFEMVSASETQRSAAMRTTENVSREFGRARTMILFASLATILSILVVVFVAIEYRIVRRLRILDHQMATLAVGDFTPQPQVAGGDELAKLSKAVEELRVANQSQKVTEDNLRDATERAQQASKLKSDFLSMMSHEIRTPLNAIMGIFELIESAPDHKRNQIRAHHGRSAAEGMFAMLTKVLDAARIEAGQTQVIKENVELENLRSYVEGVLEGAISKSNADIEGTVLFDCSLPKTFWTDEGFVQQILTNLLDNAVRFTDSGTVSVRGYSYVKEEQHRIVFEVEDTGIGISHGDAEIIFDQFHQVDGSITRKKGGSGLGLAITKQLTEQLGGTIHVVDTTGKGTKFLVEFPLR